MMQSVQDDEQGDRTDSERPDNEGLALGSPLVIWQALRAVNELVPLFSPN